MFGLLFIRATLFLGGLSIGHFDASHLEGLSGGQYPIYSVRTIDTYEEGDDKELMSAVRRLNPDFDDPDYEERPDSYSSAYFEVLRKHKTPAVSIASRSRTYYEPVGKRAREYQEHPQGYHQQQVRVEKVYLKKKVYVPVSVVPKKKKRKILSIDKGFHIAGGTQVFGKFKKLKQCMKLCSALPTCFAADYNPWLHKCYIHSNITACSPLRAHKKFIHFKKVPCEVPEAPQGLITLGAQLFNGLEQEGIKSLQDCLKKCASAGGGIAPSITSLDENYPQLCFGIDYDFGTHKCYFFTDRLLCPPMPTEPVVTPTNLVANPSVVNILLCPAAI